MNITDYFPSGTKLVIEVVPFKDTCRYCIFKEYGDCEEMRCTASCRPDHKDVYFKLVEVKEP